MRFSERGACDLCIYSNTGHIVRQVLDERLEDAMSDETSVLGACLKRLRTRRGWSIAETARRAGLSASMLWKVENGQTTLTHGKLARLAEGLQVPIGELFSPAEPATHKSGRRVVDRRGTAPVIDCSGNLHHFLGTGIASKHYFPCVIEVNADGDGSDAEKHGGEEFAYVMDGRIELHCEGYSPVVLDAGDSVYFDASLKHRYLRVDGPARLLCVYSHPEHLQQELADTEPHSRAMQLLRDVATDQPLKDDKPMVQARRRHAAR
jgi:transcriptional regulator with XRE-family HTH domain